MSRGDEESDFTDVNDPSEWTLITVTYNSVAQLTANWTSTDLGRARWLVVDNRSTDESIATARALGAEVMALPANVGFSAANNRGLSEVDTPWTMFVNPDVSLASPADLNRLAAVSRHNKGALVAPQLLNPDGSEQSNARGLPFLTDKVANRAVGHRGSPVGQYAKTGFAQPTYAAWVMGAAVGGPTETFRSLGGWDERYFIYYEDHDLGLRMWDSGGAVVVDPEVRWTHEWQRATSRLAYTPWLHELRSMRSFYRAHPQFLSKRRFERSMHLTELQSMLWKPAAGPQTSRDGRG